MSTGWKLEHTYGALPEAFYFKSEPVAVAAPSVVVLNEPLALCLGFNPERLRAEAPGVFSGNSLAEGMQPIAQAYAGHQYGHFTMLGDGRAILLGEQIDPQGQRWDVQLKGAGRTPFSRRGDGRAALGPMLREYLISEAMFALGIPTTRSLAVVATGEPVFRETTLPGAVLTRVAASHIRVGTFEYAAMKGPESVRHLADYAIQRHYPEIQGQECPYALLLSKIISRQASLIAAWMNVGFVHGVMNTDNMAISGETIDYGPCAFMDRYDPAVVFSSIDHGGRYAYGNQVSIAHWNLTRLAETLLTVLNPKLEVAIATAEKLLGSFAGEFTEHWLKSMRGKLGLFEAKADDEKLIGDLLLLMQKNRMDYTNSFRALVASGASWSDNAATAEQALSLKDWAGRWQERRKAEGRSIDQIQSLMHHSSPNLIPRNHQVEGVLSAAMDKGDLEPFKRFVAALQHPFEELSEHLPYRDPPPNVSERYLTFCGT